MDAPAQLLVQGGLVERAAALQRVGGRGGDLVERVRRGEALLGRELLDLAAELGAELVVVARDQGAAVEREVVRRERVDRAADDVRDDEVAGVDGHVVALAGDVVAAGREREQGGVAAEVRRRARGGRGEADGVAGGQPRAGEAEREDLVGVHGHAQTEGNSSVSRRTVSNSPVARCCSTSASISSSLVSGRTRRRRIASRRRNFRISRT